jgi:RNA polymerase sigma factor (sigma-70 family)
MSPTGDEELARLIRGAREGDVVAQQRLWERFFDRLVGFARPRLQQRMPGAPDAEDVALSALDSFLDGVRKGEFPDLHDPQGLWPLLVRIAGCKVKNVIRDQRALKRLRPGGRRGEDGPRIEDVICDEPTPELAAQIDEEYQRLLAALGGKHRLREVAQGKVEGLTNREIAERLGCVERTVERKLRQIREIWEERTRASREGD